MFRTKTNPFVTNEAKVTKGLMCPELQAPGLSHLSRDILHWSDRESKHLWHYQCNMIYFYLFLNCKLMVMIRLVSGYTWDVNPSHTENTDCDLMLPKSRYYQIYKLTGVTSAHAWDQGLGCLRPGHWPRPVARPALACLLNCQVWFGPPLLRSSFLESVVCLNQCNRLAGESTYIFKSVTKFSWNSLDVIF